MNLHAVDLNDVDLLSPASPLAAIASRVVLEITERASLHQVNAPAAKVENDLGAGYAGLSSFTQLEPDFVKLDMSLIRGLDKSPRKRSVVRAITRLRERARHSGGRRGRADRGGA